MHVVNYQEKKRPFDFWKLAALAVFAYYLITIAMGYDVTRPTEGGGSFASMIFYNSTVMPHEFGHFIFARYGQIFCVAGGTILELTVPLSCLLYFFFTGRFYSAALAVSYLGETIIFVSIYMATAISQEGTYYLPGVGSVSQADYPGLVTDWNYLFSQMGVLPYTPLIAQATYDLGFILVIIGIILGVLSSRKGDEEF